MNKREVVIVDGCRTAFGKRGGSLKTFAATELGGICVKALLERTQILERGGTIDSLFTGMAILDAKTAAPARYISQAAEPLLTEDGSLTVEAGQFMYVYCSANAFTDLAPDTEAKLLVTFAE